MAEECNVEKPDTNEKLYRKIDSTLVLFGPKHKYYYKEKKTDEDGNEYFEFIHVYVKKAVQYYEEKPGALSRHITHFHIYTCGETDKYYKDIERIQPDLYLKISTAENNLTTKQNNSETNVDTLERNILTTEKNVDTLEGKVAALEKKVAALEEKVADLEGKKGGKRSRKAKKQKKSRKMKSRSRK